MHTSTLVTVSRLSIEGQEKRNSNANLSHSPTKLESKQKFILLLTGYEANGNLKKHIQTTPEKDVC